MMTSEVKAKVAVALGALLSVPVLKGVLAGTIPTATAAVRVALGMVVAYAAVTVVAAVVAGYLPTPVEPPPDGIEDAILVDDPPPADTL